MLKQKLLDYDYYYNKLPLYLKNSHGYWEHFEIWVKLLNVFDSFEDELLELFDVFNDNYMSDVVSKYSSSTAYDFEFLDILGSLYGLQRTFNITYENVQKETVTEAFHLNNEDFLLYIKSYIIKANYKGTYEEAREYYEKIGLIVYLLNTNSSGYCVVYGDTEFMSEDVKRLFLAGAFNLESMGIVYTILEAQLEHLGYWGSTGEELTTHNQWNVALRGAL